ncbi:MAG: hypothetical protein NTV86_04285 [Planctomycetota bacterium]|nr:hypothetical protein [Planctomycetota bacterium]
MAARKRTRVGVKWETSEAERAEAKRFLDTYARVKPILDESWKRRWAGDPPPDMEADSAVQTRWWQEKAAEAGISGQAILDSGVVEPVKSERNGNRLTIVFGKEGPSRFEPIVCGAMRRADTLRREQCAGVQGAGSGNPAKGSTRHHRRMSVDEETWRAKVVLLLVFNGKRPKGERATRRQVAGLLKIGLDKRSQGKSEKTNLKALERWAISPTGANVVKAFAKSPEGLIWQKLLEKDGMRALPSDISDKGHTGQA